MFMFYGTIANLNGDKNKYNFTNQADLQDQSKQCAVIPYAEFKWDQWKKQWEELLLKGKKTRLEFTASGRMSFGQMTQFNINFMMLEEKNYALKNTLTMVKYGDSIRSCAWFAALAQGAVNLYKAQ